MRRLLRIGTILIVGGGLLACDGGEPPAATGTDEAAAAQQQLHEVFDGFFEEQLAREPFLATIIGDNRFNDQFPNYLTADYRVAEQRMQQRWLDEARRIDRALLSGQDRLNYDIFVYQRQTVLEGLAFPDHLLPISQFFSLPSLFAQIGSGDGYHPFRTEQDYRDFMRRMEAWAVVTDQTIANMRQGVEQGVVQPAVLMTKVLPQLAAHVVDDPTTSVFYQPLTRLPEGVIEEAADALRADYAAAIATHIIPSYRKLHDYIRDEYLPHCRDTVALSALPDGAAWYAYLVKTQTTSDLTPEAIHAYGNEEVARIEEEMRQVMAEVGFSGELADFFAALEADERFYAPSAEALLQGYRDLQQKVNGLIPALFDIFPRHDYEVRAMPDFMAETSSGAFYQEPAADGSRPGVFYINTFNLRAQPTFVMESLSIHEASPGHHFQISIAQEIESLPRFRRFSGFNAYYEGWALYIESIGKELGLFTDPYQYYGRLSEEMLRAMRLVVDTGLHHLGWSREQAIDYMLSHSSMAKSDVVAEVERYIAFPGQALGYKVGQRTFTALRAKAEAALGERFDIKAFHREVLIDGTVPLNVLEQKIDAWLAEQTARASAGRAQG